jgi:glutathione peroxidase-family protein
MSLYDIEVTTIEGRPQSMGAYRGKTLLVVKWNFTKFLVGADGTVLKRYAPKDTPESIGSDLGPLLKNVGP